MRNEDVNLDWLEKLKPTNRTLTEIADDELENTKNKFGRLLTEEEIVQMVDEARKDLRKREKF